nr:hypothetical protein [Actinomycetota bacterium]
STGPEPNVGQEHPSEPGDDRHRRHRLEDPLPGLPVGGEIPSSWLYARFFLASATRVTSLVDLSEGLAAAQRERHGYGSPEGLVGDVPFCATTTGLAM